MNEFLKKNGRSITILLVLTIGWLIIQFLSTNSPPKPSDITNAHNGDIYVFSDEGIYAPMRLDSVSSGKYMMRDYLFVFEDAIPKQSQILSNEFDTIFYAIYEQKELLRLLEEGSIVEIYHP